MDTDGALLVFDESQYIRNFIPDDHGVDSRSDKAQVAVLAQGMMRNTFQEGKAVAGPAVTVFSSATPILNPAEAGYLAGTGIFDRVGGFVEWAQIYGATPVQTSRGTITVTWKKGGRETVPIVRAARTWVLQEGVFSRQAVHLPPFNMVYTSFWKAPLDPIAETDLRQGHGDLQGGGEGQPVAGDGNQSTRSEHVQAADRIPQSTGGHRACEKAYQRQRRPSCETGGGLHEL